MRLTAEAENRKQAERFLAAGADEILFTLEDGGFSAPAGVSEDLITEMYEEGMPVRTVMDRLFHPRDIEPAEESMMRLLSAGVPVTCADPALIRKAMQNGLAHLVTYRPQTLAVSAQDVSWWLSCGLQSVCVSPLLTEEETLQILQDTGGAEVQLHGYTVLSVSGRPLLSAYAEKEELPQTLRGRRDLYMTEEQRAGRMPVYENEHAFTAYSDYVLESFAQVKAFRDAGAVRGVICTAYLSEDYVCDTLRIYRSILAGTDPAEALAEYWKKYAEIPMEEGYYHEGTIL